MKKLMEIQAALKAPKSQFNKFGGYNYRSCEDILEAVKPLLAERGAQLVVSDEIVEVGGRVYVKATATITAEDKSVSATAYAREPAEKKGMDASQITGTASSYARKYALNGLFLIDDSRDADTDEYTAQSKGAAPAAQGESQRVRDLILKIESYEVDGVIKDDWKPKIEAYRKAGDVAGLEKVLEYCRKQSAQGAA